MRCLLTGASGYLGRALLPALLERGCTVTAQARRGTIPSYKAVQPMVLRGDLRELADSIPLEGIEQVFHLAAIAHQRGDARSYLAINVDATRRLALRARDAGVRRFVFVSSVKAAQSGKPLSSSVDYGASKRLAEESLEAVCAASSMELVIVRPALVYDTGAPGHLAWLRRWVDLHLPAPPRGGARSMVSRPDLVALLCALLAPAAAPQRMTLTDGEAYTTRRLHAAFCRSRARFPRLPSPPEALWRAACDTVDWLRRHPAGSSWQRLTGSELHAQGGLAEVGFRPCFTFERLLGLT